MTNQTLKSTIKTLKHPIIGTAHKDPDIDAIGSLLALRLGLKQKNHDLECYVSDYKPTKFQFLPHYNDIQSIPSSKDCHSLIYIDCSNEYRIKFPKKIPKASQTINIDHHQDNTLFGTINIVHNISSVGELLYKEMLNADIVITPEIAKNLYAAIAFDTGSFQYTNTTPSTLAIASELLKIDPSISQINKYIFDSKSTEYFEEVKIALDHLYIDENNPFIMTHIPLRKNASSESTINFLDNIMKKKSLLSVKK